MRALPDLPGSSRCSGLPAPPRERAWPGGRACSAPRRCERRRRGGRGTGVRGGLAPPGCGHPGGAASQSAPAALCPVVLLRGSTIFLSPFPFLGRKAHPSAAIALQDVPAPIPAPWAGCGCRAGRFGGELALSPVTCPKGGGSGGGGGSFVPPKQPPAHRNRVLGKCSPKVSAARHREGVGNGLRGGER